MTCLDSWRVLSHRPLLAPHTLKTAFPCSLSSHAFIAEQRQQAIRLMTGASHRLLLVLGPCSIHDAEAALSYASEIKKAINIYGQQLHLIMRVYFEKPRTIVGWKGWVNDPYLDGSCDIHEGLRRARKLLAEITALEVPVATEFIDVFSPHYLSDFISWGAIGARTSESRLHRELASGLPMMIGFKNNRDGNIQIAIDAVKTAAYSHHFLTIDDDGLATILETQGNPYCHIVLRGANLHTNYHEDNIANSVSLLKAAQLPPFLMVDCSHGNSRKQHLNQIDVAYDLARQIAQGSQAIAGLMLESFLEEGRQDIHTPDTLCFGQSITDACLSWQQTLSVLDRLAESVELRKRYV